MWIPATVLTRREKFYCRPAASTFFQNEPFGERVEGLSSRRSLLTASKIVSKQAAYETDIACPLETY